VSKRFIEYIVVVFACAFASYMVIVALQCNLTAKRSPAVLAGVVEVQVFPLPTPSCDKVCRRVKTYVQELTPVPTEGKP
jgi:hypothetical protein